MKVLMTIPATPSFPFDRTVAEREGWGLAEAGFHTNGTPIMELQAIQDNHPALADDQAAWAHVVARARQGSDLHRAALAAVDDVERTLIEATCGAW
jgi:hypothetical protein